MEKIVELRKKRKAPDQNDEERQVKRQRTNKQKNGENKNKNHNKKPKLERITNGKDHNNGKNGDNVKEEENGIENDVDEDIEYGTFDYSSGKPIPTYLSHKKKGLDKKILLQKAMEKQRMLEELKDTEEGKQMKDDIIYDTLIKRAQGIKVKDDPKKIKKKV